ncbi:hypothetical protein [Thermococcus thermotolerans]|uniref:hypothetical protein n=1 Tax=Thermococcus thermotolerans TaxID=2969672 RepID=UPI002157E6F6|nr:hypothetical protein [Thermococcus thermotolerans]
MNRRILGSMILVLLVFGIGAIPIEASSMKGYEPRITKDILKQVMKEYVELKAQERTREADMLLEKYGIVKLGEIKKTFSIPVSGRISLVESQKFGKDLPHPDTWVSQSDLTLTIEYLLQQQYATLFIDYYWEWDLTEDLADSGDMDVISITTVVGKTSENLLVRPVDVWGGQLESGSAFGNHDVVKTADDTSFDWNSGVLEHQLTFKVGDQIKRGVIQVMYDINTEYLLGRGGAITTYMTYVHTFGNKWLEDVTTDVAGLIANGATTVILKDPIVGTVVSRVVEFAVDRAVSWALENFGVVRDGMWAADPVDAYISLPDYWPPGALSIGGTNE